MEMIINFMKKTGKKQLVIGPGADGGSLNDTMPLHHEEDQGSEVSEQSMEENQIVDIVNGGLSDDTVCDNDKENPLMHDVECVTADSIIEDEYCEEVVTPHLPPVEEKLAKIVTNWLHVAPSRKKVKEMFKRCMLPENIEGLAPVRINQLLYEKLTLQYKLNDQKLCGINTYFARGLGPLIAVWDKILKWEAFLLNWVKDKKFEVDLSTMQHKDISLDFTSLRKDLDKAIRLLCTGHSMVLDK